MKVLCCSLLTDSLTLTFVTTTVICIRVSSFENKKLVTFDCSPIYQYTINLIVFSTEELQNKFTEGSML
jgi:hypothetical protein